MGLDIFIVLIIALFVIFGVKRGVARTLLNLLALVLSGVFAYFVSKFLSVWVYENFFEASIRESVVNSVTDAVGSTTSITSTVFDGLPDFVSGLLSTFGLNSESLFTNTVITSNNTIKAISETIMNTVSSAVISLLFMLMIVLLFVIFYILLKKFAVNKILKIFKIPVLKQLNGILGGAVGLCEGIVLCTLFILLCAIYVPLNSNFFINQTLINQSYFFSQIYYSDVVVMISSFVSEGKEAFGLFKNIG